MEPTAPLAAMTNEMMKKETATMASDSRQLRPTAMILLANCQVAALKASEIQYAGSLAYRSGSRLGDRTDETERPPMSLMERNRIEITVRPAGIALRKGRFGLGDSKTGTEAHC